MVRLILPVLFLLLLTAPTAGLRADAAESPLTSRGKELAALHCSACHELPAPNELTRESWEFCLTYMGYFLGIDDGAPEFGDQEQAILSARKDFITTAGLMPSAPVLSSDEWETLRTFYLSNSPTEPLPQTPRPAIQGETHLFRAQHTRYDRPQALTSMVLIDEERQQMLLHDGLTENLTILDRDGDLIAQHPAPGVVLVEGEFKGKELLLLSIGDLFASRIGEGFGELQRARVVGGLFYGLEVLIAGLHRPSDFVSHDLNSDGQLDALISNFGDYTGNLSLYLGNPDGSSYDKTPIKLLEQPGIVQTQVHDFTGDGRPDIAVLAGHAREGLSILVNQGDAIFESHAITTQSATFGYTGLELRDFNQDGQMDIITLNGDNGDSDPYNTLKPDHGIRIYLNRGNLEFELAYYYPMHGVFGAEIEDFDGDGDLDMAAIAFHPDFDTSPVENFVYLEQTTPLDFSPYNHAATAAGRWMTIDSGDLDGDGDKDLVLGAGYSPVGLRFKHPELWKKMMLEGPALLVLENQL